MESPRSHDRPHLTTQATTAFLLALGTALLIYWQPLSRTVLLKASDVVLVAAACLWILTSNRAQWARTLRQPNAWFIPPLLASILLATLLGYIHYHLGMSRTGVVLLARLLLCVVLFLIACGLLQRDASLRRSFSLAFLSPLVLLPALLIPGISAVMWDSDGRFQGLTLNANTAAAAFLIAFAIAYTLGAYAVGTRRRLDAAVFFGIAAAMLMLILWTQSRAYLIAAFGSALLGTALVARHQRLPNLKLAAAGVFGLALIVLGVLLLAPGRFTVSYLTRVSPAYYRTVDDPTASSTAPESSRPRGAMRKVERFSAGIVPRLEDDIRTPATRYFGRLLATNYLGLGLNYESKFTVYHPPTRTYHGALTILDLPVYGGVGAVLSVAYLAWLVGRRTKRAVANAADNTLPYTIASVTALGGLWGAAILVGSPLFDYQFWMLAALALA